MPGTAEKALTRAVKDRRAQLAAGAVATGVAVLAGKVGYDRLASGDGGPSRRYRLKHGESVKKGVRRIATGRADDAIEQLDRARDGDFAAGVHEARKDLKKLRSLLRLVRDGLGEETYQRENTRYRDAARRLSGARDAEARLQTLDALEERFDGELPDGAGSGMRVSLEQERPDDAGPQHLRELETAASEIAEGRRRIPDWPLDRGGWALIKPGLRRSYRRSRRAMARVREEPSGENVHEWRKRVKDLWYHLRIVRNAQADTLGGEADRAHELSDALGDHHDLVVLTEEIRSRANAFEDEVQREALLAAISRRQGELLDDAFRIGDRVYAEKPGTFAKRIKGHWKAWRN